MSPFSRQHSTVLLITVCGLLGLLAVPLFTSVPITHADSIHLTDSVPNVSTEIAFGMYVVNNWSMTISRANLDGTGGISLGNLNGTLYYPQGIALDLANSKMYVTNDNNTISRANLDGTGGENLGNLNGTLSGPGGIVLDLANNKMYVTNDNNTISRANLDGTGGISLGNLNGTLSSPWGIALDLANNKMYVTNYNSTISRANLDGTGGVSLGNLNGTLDGPRGIALDLINNKMYVANFVNSTISRANLDGTGGENLGNLNGTLSNPTGIALDLANSKMYITNHNHTISRANLDGTGGISLGNLNQMLPGPSGIALVSPRIATTTTLTGSPYPSMLGQLVTFTATVTSTVGLPIGTVQFYADGAMLGSPVTLSSGKAMTSTAALGFGTHPITATYSGDATYYGSTSPQIVQVVNSPTNIIVTNNADSGVGSLRQAIADVNANGSITFYGDYTITLASPLTIGKNMTIDGAGHRVTISGNNAVRVFSVNSGTTFNLNQLNVTKGNAGSGNGGGIYNDRGNVTLMNSAFSGNSASAGGGILNYGTLTVTNSTLAGNSTSQGGGIWNGTYLGSSGTLAVTNSTFAGNSATSGGGIYNSNGTVTIQNSIMVKGSTGNNCYGIIGGSNNLADDASCGGTFTNSSSILLSALGYYGGNTQSFALLPGSAAINATSTNCPSTDQRGIARPQGADCDIGAYESRGFTLTKSGGDGQSTRINAGFASPLNVTLNETGGSVLSGGTITYTAPSSGASIAPPTTVTRQTNASGIASLSVTANGTAGSYNVTASATGASSVTFALTNVFPILYAKPGGLTTGYCESWANACELRYALSSSVAGINQEIWVAAGTHKPTADTNRSATFQLKNGVAIYGGFAMTETLRNQRNYATNLTVLSGDIGTAGDTGDNSYHVVTGATDAMLDGVTVSGGYANGNIQSPCGPTCGGGMYNYSSSPTLLNVTFSGNSAYSAGGGMDNESNSNPTLLNVTFSGNSAWTGGGMSNDSSSPTLENVTFSGNSTWGGDGGGMSNYRFSSPMLMNVTFSGNSTPGFGPEIGYGGGMYNDSSSPLLINVTLSGNSARWYGGGMYNYGSDPSIQNTILWGNSPDQIENVGGTPIIFSSVVQGGYPGDFGIITADPKLGTLGNYGGGTQTIPLLPGSSAINAGFESSCFMGSDQRGKPYVGSRCDIGAYESQGFTLTKTGGDNQSAFVTTAFANPLNVTLNETGGNVLSGGTITFTAPSTGASITAPTTVTSTTNTSGIASIPITANNIPGLYNVAASTNGATSVTFALTNTLPPIVYVKPSGLTSGVCESWGNACELRYAITSTVSGQEIWVAAGTYTPTTTISNRNATFQLMSGVPVYGGFAMTETLRTQRNITANLTILSGDIDNNDIKDANGVVTTTANIAGANSYHVVTGAMGATLDGVLITAGQANGGSPNDAGGGMYNSSSSPTLTNVTFSGNAAVWGGGMFNNNSSSPTLTNVTFSGNSTNEDGGGMFNNENSSPTLTNVTFSGNSASYGGGILNNMYSSPTLTNVTFSSNSATYGGGLTNYINSSPTLTNVTFSGNSATQGGGMFNESSSPTLTNVTFSGNSATDGGGMHNMSSSNPIIRNSIFWNASGGEIVNSSSTPTVTYSIVQGGYASGTNIITADPLLGTLGNNGGSTQTMALAFNSPAIDAADPANCPTTDQRGQARDDLRCDIGAFERKFSDGNQVQKTNLTQSTTFSFGPTLIKISRASTDDPGTLTIIKIPAWTSQPGNAITRLWDMSATSGTYSLTVTLCFTDTERNGLNVNNLHLWRYNGASWEDKGGTLDTTNPNITCVGSPNITALSRWTLATGNPGGTPTGVNLLRWVAVPEPNAVRLEWQTINDIGVSGYQVERSLDGKTFTAIGSQVLAIGGGTYSRRDTTLPRGQSARYRLIVIKMNGTREVYGTITGSMGSPLFLPLIRR